MKTRIVSFMFIVMMASSLFCGTAFATGITTDGTLRITVTTIITAEDGMTVCVDFDNQTGNTLRYGWTNSECAITIKTDIGDYSEIVSQFDPVIELGHSSKQYVVSGATGDIETIAISNLICGNNPSVGKTLENVEVYNSSNDANVAVVDFNLIPTGSELFFQNHGNGVVSSDYLQSAITAMQSDSNTIMEDLLEQVEIPSPPSQGNSMLNNQTNIQHPDGSKTESVNTETLVMPKAEKDTLLIMVTDIEENGNNKTIHLYFDNCLDTDVAFGFMRSGDTTSHMVVNTSMGTYYHNLSMLYSIPLGTSQQSFELKDAPGSVKSIEITNLISGTFESDGMVKSTELYSSNSGSADEYEFEAVVLRDKDFFSWAKILKPVSYVAFPLIFIFGIWFNVQEYKRRKKMYQTIINKATQADATYGASPHAYSNRKYALHDGTNAYESRIKSYQKDYMDCKRDGKLGLAGVLLRNILERMVEGIWETARNESGPRVGKENRTFNLINLLYEVGLITENSKNNYHWVRINVGNSGAHGGTVDADKLNQAERIIWEELKIYYNGYAGASSAPGWSGYSSHHQTDTTHQQFVQQEQQRIFQQQQQDAMRAHDEAIRQHQQFVQDMHQQQFDHFSQQNITPMDQGGFVPPPPPPPPPPPGM